MAPTRRWSVRSGSYWARIKFRKRRGQQRLLRSVWQAGGVVNFVTKSGGNHIYGNAQYYWNGSVFNANGWINKAVGNSRPFDIANQWAASVGGPVKKDTLFYSLTLRDYASCFPSMAR